MLAVGESATAVPPTDSADDGASKKQFDPWHFGAIPIPPELIKEYDEAMQRFETGEPPGAVVGKALEAGSKVQAYKEGWGKPLSRQFSEDAARVAVTQASMVRVRQAKARRLALGGVAALSLLAFALIWWGLDTSGAPKAENQELLPAAEQLPREAPSLPSPPPSPVGAPGENADPAAAATMIATGTEQVPTPSAGSNPEPPVVPPAPREPHQPASPKATTDQGNRARAADARSLTNPGPGTTAQPAAAAPAAADDILGGPMTRRPKPKKSSP